MEVLINKGLLNKITIVLLTVNRRQYVLRNMKYWSGKDVTVHVLDGSEQGMPFKYFSTIKNNIYYHHLPISLSERLAYVSSLITSQYTMLMGDDEFYIPSAIEACIDELENNVSLASCFGRCMYFNHHKGALKTKLIYKNMADYSVQHSNPDDRVLYHMKNYRPSTIYSVMRTDVWKNTVSCMDNELYKVFALEELQFEIASSYLGKSRVLPVLLWISSAENPGITDKSQYKAINDWWTDTSNDELKKKMLRGLASKILINQDNVDIEHTMRIITKSIEMFMHRPIRKTSIKTYVASQVASLLSMLPRIIKDVLQKPAHTIFYPLNNFYNIGRTVKELKIEGVNVDLKELKNIESTVLGFYK